MTLSHDAAAILDALDEYRLPQLVETGAGENALTLEVCEVNRTVQVTTHEWSHARWSNGVRLFQELRPWASRVNICWSDSGTCAGDRILLHGQPALFWFQAHLFDDEEYQTGEPKPGNLLEEKRGEWSGKMFPRRNGDGTLELTPLLRELETLRMKPYRDQSVVLIPHVDRFGSWEGYPGADDLSEVLLGCLPRHRASVSGNILKMEP